MIVFCISANGLSFSPYSGVYFGVGISKVFMAFHSVIGLVVVMQCSLVVLSRGGFGIGSG